MTEKGEDKSLKSTIAQKEEEILEFWDKNQIFQKSLEKDSPKGEFVFYDGPATANAKPVFHTMEPFAFKDIIPRYKTMQGYHVRRKGGWDTHGLPVELQIEKKLGFTSKKDIENYGIAEFNRLCKESVWEFIGLWKDFTKRMAYWADQENPYITYHNSYIESLWNVLKTVDDKKLLYKDYKVLPWCPRCGTALSSHELAQGYQDDKDLSVTAKFKIKGFDRAYFLAWTTTPWTLPGNVALAVGKDIVYVEAKVATENGSEILVLAKERLSVIEGQYEIIAEHKGSEMIGMEYEPLYPFLSQKFHKEGKQQNPEAFAKAYKVYAADFVTTEDGTGIVHTAVMYGQDDFVLGSQVGLPKFHLVKDDGHFLDEMDFLSGRFVKDEEVAVDIIKDLAHRGLLFKKEKYEHSYPHCWRCKTPLIYYARDSWYIKMSVLKDKLVDENEKINWEPSFIKEGRFGEWLKDIKDWAISRERYWGTPLPVWVNKNGEYKVISGVEDLKKNIKKSGNKYFVMRHGETGHNVKHVWSVDRGEKDPLTENGEKMVYESAKELSDKNIDLVIVSPFARTEETAQIVCKELGISNDKLIEDERLGEWNVGQQFNGTLIEDYFKIRNNSFDRYEFKVGEGESYADVLKRSGDFLYDIDSKYNHKNILIISHGATTRALCLVAGGFSYDTLFKDTRSFKNFDNAEIREIDFSPLPHNENFELDLHRPYIDQVELVDEKGSIWTRTKEVMDVWFDSGAMPFAQDNYPFSTKNILYPADFISEAIDQTRGWFYTLHAVGILMDRGAAFKNVICLGHIMDATGKKMSKSLGNVVDPWTVMNKHGVDALRLWMYSVNQPGDSKNFDEKTVDEIIKKVFNPLENILSFYELYKDENIKAGRESASVLDKWILSKLDELVSNGEKSLDKYNVFEPTRNLRDFVSDFSTWYIRRSRERLKSEGKDKIESLSTTKYVLLNLSKYMAPFAPFFSEKIYQTLKEEEGSESVHLSKWPETKEVNKDLLLTMSKVRDVVSKALEFRQKAGHKVRQPLKELKIKSKELRGEMLQIIQDEVNVKEVNIDENLETEVLLNTEITEDLKNEGIARDVIRSIQDARKSEGLKPSDSIKLTIFVDSKNKEVITQFEKMIKEPTGVSEIFFSEKEEKYKVDVIEGNISVSIEK